MPDRFRRLPEFLVCIVVIPLILSAVLWISLRQSGLGTSDFIQFYRAGIMVHSGQGAHLYDANLHPGMRWEQGYAKPPFETLFYVPLAFFSYSSAYRIWTFVNLALLGLIFFLLRTYGPPFGLAERLFLLAAAFHPVLAVVLQGQDSLWLLLAYVLAFLALKGRRDFSAGLALGVALIKPQLVVPFALLMLLRGYWKFIAGLAVSASVLAIISVLIVGPAVAANYPLMLLHINDQERLTFHVSPENMPNIRGLFTLLLGALVSPLALNLIIAAVSVGFLVWAKRVKSRLLPFDLQFAILLLVTILVSFRLLLHDLSLLILPAFLFLNHLQTHEPSWTASKIFRTLPFPLLFATFLAMSSAGWRDFAVAAPILAALVVAIDRTSVRANAAVFAT